MLSFPHLLRVSSVVAILLLAGVSCPVFNSENPANPAEGVVLTQGRPPEDCGQRNPRRIKAYFTIPRAEIRLGDTIYLDASCTVGRITEVKWTFDFESFPANTPSEQRFEQTLAVRHFDLQYGDRDYGDYELNNLPPFLQTFTPTTPGTHTARLLVKDHRGETQLVIHTYIVHPGAAAATTQTLRPFFTAGYGTIYYNESIKNYQSEYIPLPHSLNDGQPVILPWPPGLRLERYKRPFPGVGSLGSDDDVRNYDSGFHEQPSGLGPELEFLSVGTAGEVDSYRYDVRGTSAASRIGQLTILSAPYNKSSFDSDSGLLVPSVKVTIPAPIIPKILNDKIYPTSEDQKSGQEVPINHFPYEVSAYLFVKNSFGNMQTFRQNYRFIDSFTNGLLIPQLSVLPLSEQGEVKLEGELTPTLKMGQAFRLQSFSILNNHRFRGITKVEFDPGTGIYAEATTISPPQYRSYNAAKDAGVSNEEWVRSVSPLDLTKKDYRAPTVPGTYTTRIRMTEIATNGSKFMAEASANFIVSEPQPFAMVIDARPETAITDQQVVFDASRSTGNIPEYAWKVTELASNQVINDDPFRAGRAQFTWRFIRDGSYRVTVKGKDVNGTIREASIEYLVQAPQFEAADLPDITIVVTPLEPLPVFGQPRITYSREPLYENDTLVFSVLGLTSAVDRLEWDFNDDGQMDESCAIRVDSPELVIFSSCGVIERSPPHAPGNHTVKLRLYEKGGNRNRLERILYRVTPGNRPPATPGIVEFTSPQ